MTLPPRIPAKGEYSESARQERLSFLRNQTGATLEHVGTIGFPSERVIHNTEALVGSVEVPLGVAGPLRVNGLYAQGDFYAPLATTEGALIASINRGAIALSQAGGVNAAFVGHRMMRVPSFELATLHEALMFRLFVLGQLTELQAQVEPLTRHGQLISVEPQMIGRLVHVHFVYETGDAAGQNMVTSVTWVLAQWLRAAFHAQTGRTVKSFLIESNLSSDKKASFLSFIQGRGSRVIADCVLPETVVRQVLHISPNDFVRGYQRGVSGAIAAGMLGVNFNIANALAAFFTATGQDIASVHESAVGHLHVENDESGGLYAALVLPSLLIGTVGGGSGLTQQRECLELMGCAGEGGKPRLAEIIAGFCLGLELSLAAALASDEFASAHEKLGRNRPT